jgi:uncharacterized protein
METPPTEASTPSPAPKAGNDSWRLYLELLSLIGLVFPPFGNILGPLVLWLVKKDTEPEVDAEGKRVLNFNISWTIWSIVTCGFGFFVWIVIALVAILKAANKEPFKHPLTLELLK